MKRTFRSLNATTVFLVFAFLIAVYFIQFLWEEKPCVYGLIRRACFIGIACCAILNIKYGNDIVHNLIAISFSFFGIFTSIWQRRMSASGSGHGFATMFLPMESANNDMGLIVFGLNLVAWAQIMLMILAVPIVANFILLVMKDKAKEDKAKNDKTVIITSIAIYFITFLAIILR